MEADASSNPYNKTLKITDFDQVREHNSTKTMSLAGTCCWMAPEVLTAAMFSKSSDVWRQVVLFYLYRFSDILFVNELLGYVLLDKYSSALLPFLC